MRYLLILFLIMAFVVGCGCSNNPMVPPAYGYFGDDKDVWPALFGTVNGAADNGYFVTYDQGDAAWDAPRLVDNDLLAGQWTPQRNSIGWDTGGTWNASFIENTGNDLEIWQSPDADWQDEAGAWGMLDSDASQNWLAVDVETRQNYVWMGVYEPTPLIAGLYIDLAAGVPAFTGAGGTIASGSNYYSLVLDKNLYGITHCVYIDVGGALIYEYWMPTGASNNIAITVDNVDPTYPQIIIDNEQRLWCFYVDSNVLELKTQFDTPNADLWEQENNVYIATALTDDYHATWCAYDNTIHVVLVDEDVINPNATYLIYMRRTANGWTEQEILLTVDSRNMGDDDHLVWPQITVDKLGNIFVYYIFLDTFIAAGGDLQGFYLDSSVYGNPVAGSWVQHVDIDDSGDQILWVVAPDSIPISADM